MMFDLKTYCQVFLIINVKLEIFCLFISKKRSSKFVTSEIDSTGADTLMHPSEVSVLHPSVWIVSIFEFWVLWHCSGWIDWPCFTKETTLRGIHLF